MKPRVPPTDPPSPAQPAPRATPAPRSSGRVQFDHRGQAVWAWAVQTGMFDRNASTQRIQALVEAPLTLAIDEPTPPGSKAGNEAAAGGAPGAGTNPYERAEPRPKLRRDENAGFDPYSSGPAKPGGGATDPYAREVPKKR